MRALTRPAAVLWLFDGWLHIGNVAIGMVHRLPLVYAWNTTPRRNSQGDALQERLLRALPSPQRGWTEINRTDWYCARTFKGLARPGVDQPGGRSTQQPILLFVQRVRVLHFSDPGCPWAYSARPAHTRLRWRFGDQLDWQLVLIGLSESTERYEKRGLTPARQAANQRSFRDRFGMPFGLRVKPRMAPTTRACRAIAAVREQDPERADAALRALQLLQFTTDHLLDEDAHLREALATVPGVDADAAVARIDDPRVIALYEADKARARTAEGGATHAQDRHSTSDGPVRFTAPSLVFERNGTRLEAGGFQPFEAYDLVLANLAPELERRPAPADAIEVLEAFPLGVTTAEAASVLRPNELVDADRAAAEEELFALAAEGRATREPLGQDAIWRATP